MQVRGLRLLRGRAHTPTCAYRQQAMAPRGSRKRKKRSTGPAQSGVAPPNKRVQTSFAVLHAVARAADELLKSAAIENTPGNRVQVSIFIRGINALKAVRVLTEEGHWEFAAGPVRQVFELLINTEEILRQADLDEALQKYVKFGLMQTVRDRQENLLYERDTGRPFNEKQLAYLDQMLTSAFPEFRKVSKNGRVEYAASWCGKSAWKLANDSGAAIRERQYTLLFATWSEQVHASPSTMLDDIFGKKAVDIAGTLKSEEPKTAEIIAMAVTLFIELWRLLPIIPDPDDASVKGWTGKLIEEALRWHPATRPAHSPRISASA
jgi:hypothetical protein